MVIFSNEFAHQVIIGDHAIGDLHCNAVNFHAQQFPDTPRGVAFDSLNDVPDEPTLKILMDQHYFVILSTLVKIAEC